MAVTPLKQIASERSILILFQRFQCTPVGEQLATLFRLVKKWALGLLAERCRRMVGVWRTRWRAGGRISQMTWNPRQPANESIQTVQNRPRHRATARGAALVVVVSEYQRTHATW